MEYGTEKRRAERELEMNMAPGPARLHASQAAIVSHVACRKPLPQNALPDVELS